MDGVSATAGIVGILGFSGQLLSGLDHLHQLYNSFRDFPDDIQNGILQVQTLRRLLEEIRDQYSSEELAPSSPIWEILKRLEIDIERMRKFLEKYQPLSGRQRRKWARQAGSYVFNRADFEKIRGSLDSDIGVLCAALQMEHGNFLREFRGEFRGFVKDWETSTRIGKMQLKDVDANRQIVLAVDAPVLQNTASPDAALILAGSSASSPQLNGRTLLVKNQSTTDLEASSLVSISSTSSSRPDGQLSWARSDSNMFNIATSDSSLTGPTTIVPESPCHTPQGSGIIFSKESLLIKRKVISKETQCYSNILGTIYQTVQVTEVDHMNENGYDRQEISRHAKRTETETTYKIVPKSWLLPRTFQLSMSQVSQNSPYLYNFRNFNVRPADSLVFAFCSSGNIDAVRCLFQRGDASPFDIDEDGWTPLHYAAQMQRHNLCRFLLTKGASAETLDHSGSSPLHQIDYLKPSSKDLFSPRDETTYRDTVRELVQHGGSDPSVENGVGKNGYDCIFAGQTLEYCVDIKAWILGSTKFPIDVERRDSSGMTLLLRLSQRLDLYMKCIDILLHAGADINTQYRPALEGRINDRRAGYTPLHFAVNGGGNNFKFLMSRGANPHMLCDRGYTPTVMFLFTKNCFLQFLEWRDCLLDVGYDLRDFVRDEVQVLRSAPAAQEYYVEGVMQAFGFSITRPNISGDSQFLTYNEERDQTQRNPDCTDLTGRYIFEDDSESENDFLRDLFASDAESEASDESDYAENLTEIPACMRGHYVLSSFEAGYVADLSMFRKFMDEGPDQCPLPRARAWWESRYLEHRWWIDTARRFCLYSDQGSRAS